MAIATRAWGHTADTAKASLLVTANGPRVGGIRIGLHLCDSRVVKEPRDERGDHKTSDSVSQLVFIAQKLIRSVNARVGFVLPPATSAVNRAIRLDEPYGFAGKQGNVRLD